MRVGVLANRILVDIKGLHNHTTCMRMRVWKYEIMRMRIYSMGNMRMGYENRNMGIENTH